jgi:4,5-dihydroxyphthalate decarboxylase
VIVAVEALPVTATIRLYFREPTIDTNRPIALGTVPIEGFALQLVGSEAEADAWDCGFAARMLNFGSEPGCLSIPAFPNRKFRHSYIFVNARAGIETPRDLVGKRVGIINWANTAGVWARGALQHYYGIDLAAIRWVAARADATQMPAQIGLEYLRDRGRHPAGLSGELDDLLLAGELDAVIDPNVPPSITRRDGRTRRLFRDYKSEEQAYFKATGIFPISHIVTLRADFVARHPEAPVALLKSFRRARDIAIENIAGSDPQVLVLSWIAHLLDEQRALMGDDYFAYDVAHNETALDAMMRFAADQFLTKERIDFRRLFDPAAMALAGF